MTDRFEDDRGVIQDLLSGPIDAVTEIFTKTGSVRGNHVHAETVQWAYVVWGSLLAVSRKPDGQVTSRVHGAGDMMCDQPGVAHAWKALEDTKVLVFTRGPRSGANYEDDVQRLLPEERLIP